MFEHNDFCRPDEKRRSDLHLVSMKDLDYRKKVVIAQPSNAIQSLTREFTNRVLKENEFYKGRGIVKEL